MTGSEIVEQAKELYKKADIELINQPRRLKQVETKEEMLVLLFAGEKITCCRQGGGTYYHSVVYEDIMFTYVGFCPLMM